MEADRYTNISSLLSRSLIGLSWVCLVSVACSDSQDTSIPNVAVSESLVIAEPSNFPLTGVGGWVYHPGGYRGLIVYRQSFAGTSDDFLAYDRACPLHYDVGCGKVVVESDNFYITCPCDSAQWYLLNGFPLSESSGILKRYSTQFVNGVVLITN